jgi:hypothetical protein
VGLKPAFFLMCTLDSIVLRMACMQSEFRNEGSSSGGSVIR